MIALTKALKVHSQYMHRHCGSLDKASQQPGVKELFEQWKSANVTVTKEEPSE